MMLSVLTVYILHIYICIYISIPNAEFISLMGGNKPVIFYNRVDFLMLGKSNLCANRLNRFTPNTENSVSRRGWNTLELYIINAGVWQNSTKFSETNTTVLCSNILNLFYKKIQYIINKSSKNFGYRKSDPP